MSRSPPNRSSNRSGTTTRDLGGPHGEPTVPTGIKIICALRILINVLLFLIGLVGLGTSPLAPILLIAAIVDMVVVYGLLTLEHWGWTWAVVLGAINVVLTAPSSPIAAVIGALITIYIFSKKSVYDRAREQGRAGGV